MVPNLGLFRALLTTFLVLAIVSGALVVRQWCELRTIDTQHLGFAIGAVGAGILSYFRSRKRADDFAKAVLDVFLVNKPKQAGT